MSSAHIENPWIARVIASKDPATSRELYNQWATEYDKDLAGEDYQGPRAAVNTLGFALPPPYPFANRKVLDAGCGTGLVGVLLAKAGAKYIDGLDLSPGMLDVARKTGVYNDLAEADLLKPIAKPDDSYDAITCVGTLTTGHVGPEVLSEFIRIVKPGGLIVATVVERLWVSDGYEAAVDHLVLENRAELVSDVVFAYRVASNVEARMLVLRKL